MPTPAPPVTALPTPPSRDDSVNFAARADAFVGALPDFGTELNALGTNVYNNAVEADVDATAAANSAAAAAASAQAAAIASSVDAWVSGATYAIGDVVYSLVNYQTFRRTTNGAGTTDPASDAVNWQNISGTVNSVAISGGSTGLTTSGGPITSSGTITLGGTLAAANGGTGLTSVGTSGNVLTSNGTAWVSAAPGGLPEIEVVSGTTQTAVKSKHYVLTNAAATTVTLPSSPSASDTVWITVANGLTTNVVARNSSNIQSLAEDLTLNMPYAAVQLRYADSTRGWVLI
jgi:hypothetical protein